MSFLGLELGSWATPWSVGGLAIVLVSFVLDGVLSRRYAGGRGEADRGTWKLLTATVGSNLGLLLILSGLDLGRSDWLAERLGPLGFLALGLGFAVRYAAILHLGERFTWRVGIGRDHTLAKDGIFSRVRHPSYTGGLLAVAGFVLVLGNWLGGLFAVITYIPAILVRIKVEEEALLRHFGEEYERYRAATARIIPFVY